MFYLEIARNVSKWSIDANFRAFLKYGEESARRWKLKVAKFGGVNTSAGSGGHQEPNSGHKSGAPSSGEEFQNSSDRETCHQTTLRETPVHVNSL